MQDPQGSGAARAGTLSNTEIQELQSSLRGRLIQPGDQDYDTARRVYNAMIDRHPRFIARCADDADVINAVNFARRNKLLVSIRGGSHNVAGFSVCDDGIVIDLSPMKGIHVDPARRTVHAAGGCTWGDVDHATHAFGLAVPGGLISTTGVAGLTLGGGIGHLTRKYGLSCDNLLSMDVVTADGRFVTAGAGSHEDLFWALRGGGGNFGVVTSFEFRAHPVSTVIGGPVLYPIEQAREALHFYREYMAKAPDDMNAFFAFLFVPPGPPFPQHLYNKKVCGIVTCYTGPQEQADEVLKPIRQFGPPAVDFSGPIPFPALQRMFDPLVPPGLQHYWKADFMKELSDGAIDVHVKHGSELPSALSTMHIYPTTGAASRVGQDETAFAYRDAQFVHVIVGLYPDPADTPRHKDWVRNYWSALHPYSAGGAYVNFLMDEGEDRIAASYRGNYERLSRIKATYDQDNLFCMNQNIKPAHARP